MRILFRALCLTVVFAAVLCATRARSQAEPPEAAAPTDSSKPTDGDRPDAASLAASEWKLERITLTDGKSYQGLVESEQPGTIEFVEVHRPRGKPMFLVIRPIARKLIANWERLTPEEQQELRSKLEKYKNRALIEGRRMEDLTLSQTRSDGTLLWNYEGNWFTLESTADELMTRRVIVRLGQIFAAYRQVLPPRWTSKGRVHLRMFGSSDQYRAALHELQLDVKNPAIYLADKNLILAGSDLNRFGEELAQAVRQHRQVKQQLDALAADSPARLKQLGADLKKNGVSTGDRLKIILGEQKKWEDRKRAAQRKMTALDRKNAAKFDEVTKVMFHRVAHEAFHAYLENHVYPRQVYDVPRWLNEGLAQTFEAGILEADTLRIDAPNALALQQLQRDLRSSSPLELKDLLNAGGETFLAAHSSAQEASRSYYYSWGLAYYLAFDQTVVGTPQFDEYLSPAASARPAVERFEKLVGIPLDEFQQRWRDATLSLKSGPE